MPKSTKRGRPRIHATAKDKAAVDSQRKRNKRQKAAARDRGSLYSTFHNLHYPIQQFDNSESSALTRLQEQDISNFLPPPSPPLQPITEGVFFGHDEPMRSASIISPSDAPGADSVDGSLSLLAVDPTVPITTGINIQYQFSWPVHVFLFISCFWVAIQKHLARAPC
ncbi:hypothetical protein QL093DRAFT_2558830 [Fusarium oxysporum]|nr:hypothetical protein QL093DRAFT_2558830 [Fusarium oxysporum]